jgi:hypothetical protein
MEICGGFRMMNVKKEIEKMKRIIQLGEKK